MMFCVVTVLILCSIIHDAESGKSYILPALGLGGSSESSGVKITLVIANPNTKDIFPSIKLTFNNSDVLSFEKLVCDGDIESTVFEGFQEKYLLSQSELSNKTIEVKNASFPFSLQVIYEKNGYAEGYAAISTADVGTEYYVSTFCALGGYCQIAVAPVSTGLTRVYIKLPDEVDEIVFCVGQQHWRSKYHTTVNLTYPDTLQLETTYDLTGTFIYSDGPISVIAGTRSMPGPNDALFHFMEQLAPVKHWGTEFVVRGFETAYGCVIHLTSVLRKTVVEMTGFKTVEMSGEGHTLKRRLEESSVCYIKSSKPIQVMMYVGITYGSHDVIQSVGMTSVPATEHYQTTNEYIVNCVTSSDMFFQYVLEDGDFVTAHSLSTTSKVPYTRYQVDTVSVTVNPDSIVNPIRTDAGTPFGGILQCNTTVFPMAPTLIPNLGCAIDVTRMTVGDGVDNDCDGDIDEDYCFENAKITSTFISGVSENISFYTGEVTGFQEILFRIQSCGSTQLEFRDSSDGKIVIHISWSHILLYLCFPDCNEFRKVNTAHMLQNINCTSDVISYWAIQRSGKFCIGIGHRNFDLGCLNQNHMVTLTSDLVEMRFSGLMNNATLWYDVHRADCGKFSSDWRCQDAIANCYHYISDLCSNPDYSEWVDLNCRKFCGKCFPDSTGRIFVYHTAPWASVDTLQYLKIVGSNVSSSRIGVETTSGFETAYPVFVEEWQTENITCFGVLISNAFHPVYIFTEYDTTIYYSFDWNNLQSRALQPLDALGTEYMTISFGPGDLTCTGVALESGTTTDIFSGDTMTSYINYSTFSEYFYSNQSGTVLTGNKPFAVFCGTNDTSEYGKSWFQLPATHTWGTQYITPSLGTNFTKDIRAKIKMVANSNSTVVDVHGDFDGIYLLFSRGDSVELPTDPSVKYNISSNFPIGVAIIFYEVGDVASSFHIIPPIDDFTDNPVLLGYTDFVDNKTSLVATTSVGNVIEYTFNDTSLPAADFLFEFQGTDSFLLFVREYPDKVDVTASPFLYKDLSLYQICRLGVNNAVGDGNDIDCDGLADEERVCYLGYGATREDSDLDGGFGEDCAAAEVVVTGLSAPIEPQCIPAPNITGSGCWQNCQCKCSWAAKLEAYQNMNQSEQDAYNQAVIVHYLKELEVDEESLSSTVAAKQSAEDKRTSSKSIGVAGCIFIAVVLGVVVIFDFINLVQKCRERISRSEVEELN